MTAETITTSPLSWLVTGDHKKLDKQFHVDTVVTTSLTVRRSLASRPIRGPLDNSAANRIDSFVYPVYTFQVFTTLHGNIIHIFRARLNIMIRIANHLTALQNVDRGDDRNIRLVSQHNLRYLAIETSSMFNVKVMEMQ